MRHDQSAPSPKARRVDGGIIATLFAVGIALLLSSPAAIAQATPAISPYVAQLAQYGSVAQLTELSNRRRLTTLFVNEQSPFYGVQVNYVNVHRGNLTF